MRKDGKGLRVEARNEQGESLFFHLDTGSSISILNPRWYNNHKKSVQSAGIQDSLRIGGVGGVIQQQSYLMKGLAFQIGKGQTLLDSIQVGTGIDLHTGQPVISSSFTSPEEDGIIEMYWRNLHVSPLTCKICILKLCRVRKQKMYLEAGRCIESRTYIKSRAYIENRTYIRSQTYIRSRTYIRNRTYIRSQAYIGNRTYIGSQTYIRNQTIYHNICCFFISSTTNSNSAYQSLPNLRSSGSFRNL